MAASTARAYRNPGGTKSGNPTLFSLRQLVESSTWPALYRAFLLAMLEKNRFGTELYPSQRRLARELGVSYSTARRIVDRLERGHQFGRKRIVRCEGVLELLIEPNKRPGGKLRRTATYQLHPPKLSPRPTEREIEESSSGALCPFPPKSSRQEPPPVPPPAAPAKPAQAHRSSQRSQPEQPKLSRRECAKFVADVVTLMRGSNGLTPGSPSAFSPMRFPTAFEFACDAWKRTPETMREALKFWGYKFEEGQGP